MREHNDMTNSPRLPTWQCVCCVMSVDSISFNYYNKSVFSYNTTCNESQTIELLISSNGFLHVYNNPKNASNELDDLGRARTNHQWTAAELDSLLEFDYILWIGSWVMVYYIFLLVSQCGVGVRFCNIWPRCCTITATESSCYHLRQRHKILPYHFSSIGSKRHSLANAFKQYI